MLPNNLIASYKQYKKDSGTVAIWLAVTAQKCGYPKELLNGQTDEHPKSSRLKGKARKLPQSEAKFGAKQTIDSKYIITVKDFITLSDWIAKSTDPSIKVPASVASVLDRAIIVRKRHQEWWNIRIDENGANIGHSYFVGTLERVREALRPKMSSDIIPDFLSQPISQRSVSTKTPKALVNLFENLEIEEPSEASLAWQPSPLTEGKTSPEQSQYSVKQEVDLDEVYLAVHCLFNDLDNIRQYLQQVWQGYKDGTYDLIAASITTNTSINFARSIQNDFMKLFPTHGDFKKHINVIYVLLCRKNGQDPGVKERFDDEMNFAIYEDAEAMLFPAFMLLSSFNDILEPGVLPMYKPGHFGVYAPQSNRASMSSREKFREDKIVLLEILPEIFTLILRPEVPAEDEMTRGIREMKKQREVPLWLTFAAQIFLDIHHILRERVSDGFKDLVRCSTYIENDINRVLDFHKDLHVENWPKSNDQGLYQILEQITDWVKTDAVAYTRAKAARKGAIPKSSVEPFFLLKRHPLYCGMLSCSIKALTQEASIIFANAWGSITYSAHLYNALCQEKMLTSAWQDMDLALLLHRSGDIFIGDFPKTTKDYYKRFCLAMGYSAQMSAKNKRQAKVMASKSGPRSLNDISPLCRMFMARFSGSSSGTYLTSEDIDTILNKHADGPFDSGSEGPGSWIQPRIKIRLPNGPELSASEDQLQDKRIRRTKPKFTSEGVRPIQLLDSLLNAVQEEVLELSFSHFRLHITCWLLLRSIKEALDVDLRDIFNPGYLEKENQLPFIVGYIFIAAVQQKELAGLLVPKRKDMVTSGLLKAAAAVVGEWLGKGMGAVELRMLQKRWGVEVEVPDLFENAGAGAFVVIK